MSKKNNRGVPYREQVAVPKVQKDENGNVLLMCPFCKPSHPIRAENDSNCGTILQIRATQIVYKAKYDERLICVKCGEGKGEMVKFQNGFVHTPDCRPDIVALESPPEYSKFAEHVYHMKPFWKKFYEGIYGNVAPVKEVEPNGKPTGVILGYFFQPRGKHGKNKSTIPAKPISAGADKAERTETT